MPTRPQTSDTSRRRTRLQRLLIGCLVSVGVGSSLIAPTACADDDTQGQWIRRRSASPTQIQVRPAAGPFERFRAFRQRKPADEGYKPKDPSTIRGLPRPPALIPEEPAPEKTETTKTKTESSGKSENSTKNAFQATAESGNWVKRGSAARAPLADSANTIAKAKPSPKVEAKTEVKRPEPKQPEPKETGPKQAGRKVVESVSPTAAKTPTPSADLKAKPKTGSEQGDWADEMLDSLMATRAEGKAKPETDESSEATETKPKDSAAKSNVAEVETEKSRPSKSDEASGANNTAGSSVGDIPVEATEPRLAPRLDYTGRPSSDIQPTRAVASMRRGIERTLRYFHSRPEIASGRSNWGIMHALMVYGIDTQIRVGNQKYSAIAWIAGNNNCRGQRLLTHDAEGLIAKSGAGLQGHQGQFLAVLGMCNVPTTYPLYAGKSKYTVADLIEAEKLACKSGVELTFTLIGLSHYLDTDSTWTASDGEEWDFQRLLAEELKQPIVGAACGGTHRLMGYAHALRKRRAEAKPITGHWKRAEIYTNDFTRYAYSLQNRDGSMSTSWFEGRADNGEVDRKIQTTGHIVEWLLTITPDDQLQNSRLVRAVQFLYRSLYSELDRDWSIGPKGHALRSLAMYHQRVFQAGKPWVTSRIANGQSQRR